MVKTIPVTRKSMMSGVVRTKELPITQEQLDAYLKGNVNIQDAFLNLSVADREFLKSGITQEEWDTLTIDEDQEPEPEGEVDMTERTYKELKALAETLAPRSNDQLMEIMQEIYARLPWEQPIELSNGKSFVMRKFIEPQCEDNDGESVHRFGFDVAFTDGSGHIEFMCEKTGWGFFLPPGSNIPSDDQET